MKIKKRTRTEKKDLIRSKFARDEDVQLFKIILNRLKKKYDVSSTEVLSIIREEIMIPSTIFTKILSPLETDVKYLKENLDLDYSTIAKLLKRNRRAVWQAYKNAVKKYSEKLKPEETEFNIPVSALKAELSILEATVAYLKDEYRLSYHEIGELLQRDERTIWTVYSRAMKKLRR
ncbi:hypothetical protein KY360_05350 [Candidatus Woesearchaeota archaeon]|nr:hypothetical protein [Candidatus Woesearchaeota archaeon]